MAEAILTLRDIQKSFPGVHALKGVSLNVYPGEVSSPAGKTARGSPPGDRRC